MAFTKLWQSKLGQDPVPWNRLAPHERKRLRKLRRRRLIAAREIACLAGCALVVAGTALVDWRLGLIVAGTLVAAGSLFALARG